MLSIKELLELAKNGDLTAEEELIIRYLPLINKYSRRNGRFNEDCRQHLIIEFILAVRRFDINRYKNY